MQREIARLRYLPPCLKSIKFCLRVIIEFYGIAKKADKYVLCMSVQGFTVSEPY